MPLKVISIVPKTLSRGLCKFVRAINGVGSMIVRKGGDRELQEVSQCPQQTHLMESMTISIPKSRRKTQHPMLILTSLSSIRFVVLGLVVYTVVDSRRKTRLWGINLPNATVKFFTIALLAL
jgi:hypothetical protein